MAITGKIELISQAIIDERKVCFNYVDAEGERTKRKVCPLVLFKWSDKYYMTGYCELDKDYRTFRLGRMSKLKITNEVFDPDEYDDFDFESIAKEVFWRRKIYILESTHNVFLSIDDDERIIIGSSPSATIEYASSNIYGFNDKIDAVSYSSSKYHEGFNDGYPKIWYSSKLKNGSGWCRSPLEEQEYEKLDKCEEVVSYEIEPFKIHYYAGNQTKSYIPDILVEYKDGRRVIAEIKTLFDVLLPENQVKFKAIEQYAKENGYEFEVWARCGIGEVTSTIFKPSDEGNYTSWEKAVEVALNRVKQNKKERRVQQMWDDWGCLITIGVIIGIYILISAIIGIFVELLRK